MTQGFFDVLRSRIPAGIYFRFKFAHGTGETTDGDFLIEEHNIDALHTRLDHFGRLRSDE